MYNSLFESMVINAKLKGVCTQNPCEYPTFSPSALTLRKSVEIKYLFKGYWIVNHTT